jgi:hypothetical protein
VISSAQTAIMPTNSVIDASAAASSTKILNIVISLDFDPLVLNMALEHRENIVLFLFPGQEQLEGQMAGPFGK